MLWGARVALQVGIFSVLLGGTLGTAIGVAAGYFGGWIDRVVSWVADLALSLPGIIIILVVLSVYPQSATAAMITLGVLASPGFMRVVRSATPANSRSAVTSRP